MRRRKSLPDRCDGRYGGSELGKTEEYFGSEGRPMWWWWLEVVH